MGSSGSVMKDVPAADSQPKLNNLNQEAPLHLTHGPDAMDISAATKSNYMMKSTVETFASRLHATEKFRELDKDGNGFLEKEELLEVSRYVLERCIIHNEQCGIKIDKTVMRETSKRIMERVDANGDGRMDEDEFIDLCDMMSSRFLMIARAKEKFDEFDIDGSGEIDKTECIRVIEWALEMNAYIGSHSLRTNAQKKEYKDRMLAQLKQIQQVGKMGFSQFGKIFEDLLIHLELIDSAKKKFDELDIDHSGHLEVAEIDLLLESVSMNFRSKDLKQKKRFRESFMRNVDENHDGKLTLMEFIYLWDNVCSRLDLINQYHNIFASISNVELSEEQLRHTANEIQELVEIWWKTCRYGQGENLFSEISSEKMESYMSKIMNTSKRSIKRSKKDFTKKITYQDPNDYVPTTEDEEEELRELETRSGSIIGENLYNFIWHNDSKAQRENENIKLATSTKG